ncbi:H-X9-DG-CTERM domain-containing protein [Paludisphaera mucosa]|uniref:H-X9-DG-CTERM domain-containing protein n=1 Tax=Paludisphaera mucosa TaxID=3030827 RepID=UPI0034A4FFE5
MDRPARRGRGFTLMELLVVIALPTYGAVTARSFHAGGLNALLLDGSVRFIKNTIALPTWRALGTRAGGEVVSDY